MNTKKTKSVTKPNKSETENALLDRFAKDCHKHDINLAIAIIKSDEGFRIITRGHVFDIGQILNRVTDQVNQEIQNSLFNRPNQPDKPNTNDG